MVQGSDTDAFCLLEPLAKGLVFLMALDFGFWHVHTAITMPCSWAVVQLNSWYLETSWASMSILRVSNLESMMDKVGKDQRAFACEMDMYTGKCSSISALIAAISVEEILSPSVLPQKEAKSCQLFGAFISQMILWLLGPGLLMFQLNWNSILSTNSFKNQLDQLYRLKEA